MCILCPAESEIAIALDGLEGQEFPVCTAHAQYVIDMHLSLMDPFPREGETLPSSD